MVGGVQSMEEAWSRSKQIKLGFDASSYEYSVISLCYALRVSEAENRIHEMKNAIAKDDSVIESLSICLIALARAYAILGNQSEAKMNAEAALSIIETKPRVMAAQSAAAPAKADCSKGKDSTVGGMVTFLVFSL